MKRSQLPSDCGNYLDDEEKYPDDVADEKAGKRAQIVAAIILFIIIILVALFV